MKSTKLATIAVLTVITSNANAGLVGHWSFDDAGTTNGSAVSATVGADGVFGSDDSNAVHSVEGVWGNALSFDGNDYVDLSSNLANLSGLATGSISLWFKKSAAFGVLFSASDSTVGSTEMRLFDWANGRIAAELHDNGTLLYRELTGTSPTYGDEMWHHLAALSTATGWDLYIDGELDSTTSVAGTGFFSAVTSMDSINVGRNVDDTGGQWYYSGLLDELRIYDHILSASEIADLSIAPPPTIACVTIGNAENADHTTGYGGVDYEYDIGISEVTIAEFMSSDAGDGDENYWNTVSPDAPASKVSLYEAMKFCNYLTSGSISNGVYVFNSGVYQSTDRAAAIATYGTIYAIPTQDEWYKAAYYTGSGYSLYADGTSNSANPPAEGAGATGWNYNSVSTTMRDASLGTVEQNGTVNMMGNVYEWTEDATNVVARGGHRTASKYWLPSTYPGDASRTATFENDGYGFRVVKIIGQKDHAPSTIISISHFSGDVFEMVVDCPTPWSSYPKSKTVLTSGSWSNIGHATNSAGPFAITDMGSEAGINTIYIESTNTSTFFGIGQE
jgi:hypothetical protein